MNTISQLANKHYQQYLKKGCRSADCTRIVIYEALKDLMQLQQIAAMEQKYKLAYFIDSENTLSGISTQHFTSVEDALEISKHLKGNWLILEKTSNTTTENADWNILPYGAYEKIKKQTNIIKKVNSVKSIFKK